MSKRWAKRSALLLTCVLALAAPGVTAPVKAADATIRVALFIDTGKGYRGVVPTVTLTSDSGLDVKLAGSQGTTALPVGNPHAARFRVDEFTVLAAETADLGDARRVAQQLSQQKLDVSILSEPIGGNQRYEVVSGSFATYDAAQTQADTIAQKTGKPVRVKGPYHLEAGRFASLKEANHWENAFEGSGLTAHTVLVPNGKNISYAVWLGDETSKQALDKIRSTASSLYPDFSYKQPAADAYAIVQQEVQAGGNGGDVIPRYTFSPKAKLIVQAKGGGGVPVVGVEERDHRKYRGQIELSSYNGHLTVVNELPLDQYLYGVVGTEMATGWPLEALKAQAVLARTLAVGQGNKYGVANVSDTVYEQAYYGFTREAADIRQAVDETAGEVIRYHGKLTESLFYSNAGGMTADGIEAWGNPVPYLKPVESDDSYPATVAKTWYRVALSDGTIGYVRSDLVDLAPDKNPIGLATGTINTDNVNFRIGPSTSYHRAILSLPIGTPVTILASEPEENAYRWLRGPYTGQEMAAMINASQQRNKGAMLSGPVQSLTVTQTGPSGRVLAMEADGTPIAVSSPDGFRAVFRQGENSLRSTKFTVEQMGAYTVLGAGGQESVFPQAGFGLKVMGAGVGPREANGTGDQFLISDGQTLRVASKQPMFVIRGYGFGHGLGLSQFGAKAMAEQGYDYKQILQHYYQDVTIGP